MVSKGPAAAPPSKLLLPPPWIVEWGYGWMGGESQLIGFLAGVRRVVQSGGVVDCDLVVVVLIAELEIHLKAMDQFVEDGDEVGANIVCDSCANLLFGNWCAQ